MRLARLFISAAVFGLFCNIISAHEGHSSSCHSDLSILGSGNEDPKVLEEFSRRAQILTDVAKKMGANLPAHRAEIAPSHQLMALATLGRHAVRHWYDGMQLATNAWAAAGVLEFVTPGCPTCRSFYQASTPEEWQFSIFAHVLGHNDFGATSLWSRARKSDAIRASAELNRLLNEAYEKHDHDEVSQWYQELLSFQYLQDVARHTFEAPETFEVSEERQDRIVHAKVESEGNLNPYRNRSGFKKPTASVLQHLVSNLPPGTPQWKIDIAKKYEEMVRVLGFYTATKIANEGWAVTFQHLPVQHTEFTEDVHRFGFADLMTGVARREISNPYWLGREAWRRVRARWNEFPENQGLEPFEADSKFLEYAHEKIISHMTDFEFLMFALDEQWVFDQNIFLHRPALPHEQINIPMPPGTEQRVVISTDAKDIVAELAQTFADKRFQIPRVLLKDTDGFNRGVLRWVQDDVRDPNWDPKITSVPLNLPGSVLVMFLYSRKMKKPVSLETTVLVQDPKSGEPASQPVRIEVNRDGQVQFYVVEAEAEKLEPSASEGLRHIIQMYLDDEAMTLNSDLVAAQRGGNQLEKLASQVALRVPQTSAGILSHAPTSAESMLEYYGLLKRRIARSMELLFSGKIKSQNTKTGVRLAVMPIVPQIGFDQGALQKIISNQSPGIVLRKMSSEIQIEGEVAYQNLPTFSGMGISIGMRPKGPKGRVKKGDVILGPSREKGQGQGDPEDGEGDPSDEEGDDPSNQPGENGNEAGEIEIPLKAYQEFLMQMIELPNLEPKDDGDIHVRDTALEGGVRKQAGQVLYDRMMPDVIARAHMSFRKRGIDPKTVSPRQLLVEGMKLIYPSDHIVRDRVEVFRPKAKAVVLMMIDMSGSMMGWPVEATRRFVFNLKLALESRYEGVEFRFIGMDTKAHVFNDLNKFVKTNLGGGTDYRAGFKRSMEVLDEFPEDSWDRYYFGLGDSDDAHAPEAIGLFNQILNSVEFTGYVQVDMPGFFSEDLKHGLETAARSHERGGYAVMKNIPGTEFDVLMQLFPKK